MSDFCNITVCHMEPPFVVHSEKGRKFQMINRKSFGLSLCKSGQITYSMNGKSFISNQQTAVLLPKGANYTLSGNREGLFPVINFQCIGLACEEIVVIPLKNPQAYLDTFTSIQELYAKKRRLEIFSLFYKMIDNLSCENTALSHPLDPAILYIEAHLSDPTLSNTDLARVLEISEVYLRKLFLAQFKTTPKQYILDLRIQKAKQMLVETPFTVMAISEECGFTNPYHFSRVFKQRTGFTPRQYVAKNSVYET